MMFQLDFGCPGFSESFILPELSTTNAMSAIQTETCALLMRNVSSGHLEIVLHGKFWFGQQQIMANIVRWKFENFNFVRDSATTAVTQQPAFLVVAQSI